MCKTIGIWIVLSCAILVTSIAIAGQDKGIGNIKVFESGPQKAALLELYTSQGCSSCPPAERWFSKLKDDPRLWKTLVPVAFHVDYWDYLGWRDPYSSSDYSLRQRKHKAQGNSGSVYTPGFMLAGKEWRNWFNRRELPGLKEKSLGKLKITIADKEFSASYIEKPFTQKKLVLNIALLGFDITTDIQRGENHGRQLRQDFVVLDHWKLSSKNREWSGKFPSVDYTGKKAVAVWVSENKSLVPLQAVGGWL